MVDPVAQGFAQQVQGNNSSSRARNSAINKDDFLQLLLTQLRNQDPMNPMESHEFAAQLAQFSSVEQLFQLNDKLDENLEMQANLTQSIGNTLATTIVGKEVEAIGNQISYTDGRSSQLIFRLGQSVKNVTVEIFDSTGTLVRKDEIGSFGAGKHSYEWNGENNRGAEVNDGIYTFTVTARDKDGSLIPISIFMGGHITGVEFPESGETSFLVGELRINVADVVIITEAGRP